MLLSVPGAEKLRDLPGMKAVFARPLSVDCVASVAAAAALGDVPLPARTGGNKDGAPGVGHVLSVTDIHQAFRH
jgi:hypothetical protein